MIKNKATKKAVTAIVGILVGLAGALHVAANAQQTCYPDTMAATAPTSRFELLGSVAVDRQTGLMWKRCVEGVSGRACEVGEPTTFTWPSALQHVERLNQNGGYEGYSNWRMPNIKELFSLTESQCINPALNLEVFPAAPNGRLWSGSPYRFYPHYAWFVDFTDLTTNNLERFNQFPILLVRNLN